jgi:hypothetical protein
MVEDRPVAERIMRENGTDVISRGDISLVPASAAHGLALEFFSDGTV